MFILPIDSGDIVVTASRAPEDASQTPASVTVVDEDRVQRLGEPLLPALLRLTPSAAVVTSGPAGSLAEVRIRGAEANHTLLFIDGIRANDPATGNAARFEILNADLASRIEVVRGPQSALWGSEAIGGVVAVEGTAALGTGATALAEAGSFGSRRGAISGSWADDRAGIAAGLGWQRADGIDSYGGGDRDSYRNLSGRFHSRWRVAPGVGVGASGFSISGRSEFDGFDPFTFERTEDLASVNRMTAGGLWLEAGSADRPWFGRLTASILESVNRNDFQGEEINRTSGDRATISGQVEHRFDSGPVRHLLIAAVEHGAEGFTAEDTVYGGLSAQDRQRERQAVTVEWRARSGRLTGDLALRHDRFTAFRDASTVRASLIGDLGRGFALAASYGEGIAQPTFFDLYGFFPGSFVGNPELRPEHSRGLEASLRFRRGTIHAALTGYRHNLRDEIVDVFDTFPFTTRNRDEKSRRSGIEAEFGWSPSALARWTAHYAYLDATEPEGDAQLQELRRPRHSAAVAVDGEWRRLSYGASLAYTGPRFDRREDFPYDRVRLASYWLAGARVSYAASERVELFARGANLLDEAYQDVFGYRTEGRSVHVGIRLAAGR